MDCFTREIRYVNIGYVLLLVLALKSIEFLLLAVWRQQNRYNLQTSSLEDGDKIEKYKRKKKFTSVPLTPTTATIN